MVDFLNKNFRQRDDSCAGFTLIELMVVTFIIAILSVGVLNALGKAREKARDVHRIANIRQVHLALELYYDKKGGYPSDEVADDNDWDTLVQELADAEILTALPMQTGETPYFYYSSATSTDAAQEYVLGIELENEGHFNLENDIDDSWYGLDCADPVYCFKL